MNNYRAYYIDGNPIESFDFYELADQPGVAPEQFLIMNTWNQRVNGSIVSYDIDDAFSSYKKKFNIDAPSSFAELKALSPLIVRSFIVYYRGQAFNQRYASGNESHKHFHPPAAGPDMRFVAPGTRRTITAVLPIRIVEPVTEMVCLQQFEFDFVGKEPHPNSYQDPSWQKQNLTEVGEVIKIPMPPMGSHLILDFVSSHTLHWVENNSNTNNEFIFLVQDI